MQLLRTVAEVRAVRRGFQTFGLVPTMGFLHEGHLSLVRRARAECDAVLVSIFVNPTQFAPGDDLARYPRDLDRDVALLDAEGVDLVFAPEVAEMYPPGFATTVDVARVTETLEGGSRPGHFAGVATVVAKLFNIVQPTHAYFGQKDAQQAVVIHRMSADLNLPVQVVVAPIVREPDGLALSSRNIYLSPSGREAATVLSRALREGQALFMAGERDGEALRTAIRQAIAAEPGVEIDYVSVADPQTLREVKRVGATALASLAARVERTRLIDNLLLEAPD